MSPPLFAKKKNQRRCTAAATAVVSSTGWRRRRLRSERSGPSPSPPAAWAGIRTAMLSADDGGPVSARVGSAVVTATLPVLARACRTVLVLHGPRPSYPEGRVPASARCFRDASMRHFLRAAPSADSPVPSTAGPRPSDRLPLPPRGRGTGAGGRNRGPEGQPIRVSLSPKPGSVIALWRATGADTLPVPEPTVTSPTTVPASATCAGVFPPSVSFRSTSSPPQPTAFRSLVATTGVRVPKPLST